MPGIEWDTQDVTHMGSPHAELIKGIMRPRSMQIILAVDFEDPGQETLWRAARSRDGYWFRLRFSNPGLARPPARQWFALVTAMEEAFDAANSAVKMLATLQLNSDVQRIEGIA